MPADSPREKTYLLCTGEIVRASKIWKFPNVHIVGEIQLHMDRDLEKCVNELVVYRQSLPTDEVLLIRPPIAAFVPIARRVPCSLCERAPRWDITQSAFDALMKHYSVKTPEEG